MTLPWEELGYADAIPTPNQNPQQAIDTWRQQTKLEPLELSRFESLGIAGPFTPDNGQFAEQSLAMAKRFAMFESPSADSEQMGYVRLKEDNFVPRQLTLIELSHVDAALRQPDKLTFSERIALQRMKRVTETPLQSVGHRATYLAASVGNIFGLADATIPGLKEYRREEMLTDPDSPDMAAAMGRLAAVPAEAATFGYLLRGISALSPLAKVVLSKFPFLNNAGTALAKPAAVPLAEFAAKYPAVAQVAVQAFRESAKVGVASAVVGAASATAGGLSAGETFRAALNSGAWGLGIGAIFGAATAWEVGRVPRAENAYWEEVQKFTNRDPSADPVKLIQAYEQVRRGVQAIHPSNEARQLAELTKTAEGRQWIREHIKVAPPNATTTDVATTVTQPPTTGIPPIVAAPPSPVVAEPPKEVPAVAPKPAEHSVADRGPLYDAELRDYEATKPGEQVRGARWDNKHRAVTEAFGQSLKPGDVIETPSGKYVVGKDGFLWLADDNGNQTSTIAGKLRARTRAEKEQGIAPQWRPNEDAIQILARARKTVQPKPAELPAGGQIQASKAESYVDELGLLHIRRPEGEQVLASIIRVPGPSGEGAYIGSLRKVDAHGTPRGEDYTQFQPSIDAAQAALRDFLKARGLPSTLAGSTIPHLTYGGSWKEGALEKQPGYDPREARERTTFVEKISTIAEKAATESREQQKYVPPFGDGPPQYGQSLKELDIAIVPDMVKQFGDFWLVLKWDKSARQVILASDFAKHHERITAGREREGDYLREVFVKKNPAEVPAAQPEPPAIVQTPESLKQLRSLRSKIWARAAVQKLPEPEVRAIIKSVAGVDHLREITDPAVLQNILTAVKPMPEPPELTENAGPTPEELAKQLRDATIDSAVSRITSQAPPQTIDPVTGGVENPELSKVGIWWKSAQSLEYIATKLDAESPHVDENGDNVGGPLFNIIENLNLRKQGDYRKLLTTDRQTLRDGMLELYPEDAYRKMSEYFSNTPARLAFDLPSGNKINLTVGQIFSILGTVGRPGGRERLTNKDGWELVRVGARPKFMNKSPKRKAITMPPLSEADLDYIVANAPKAATDALALVRSIMRNKFEPVNALHEELEGTSAFPKELLDTYWPFRTRADWTLHNEVPQSMTRNVVEPNPTGASPFQRSDPSSTAPLVIEDGFKVGEDYVKDVDLFLAIARDAKDAYAILNNPRTLQAVRSVHGDQAVEMMQDQLSRFVGTTQPENIFDRAAKRALRNAVTAIVASVKIGLSQLSSRHLATYFLDTGSVMKFVAGPRSAAESEYAKRVISNSQELLARAAGIGPERDMALSEDDMRASQFGDKPQGFYSTVLPRYMDAKTVPCLILAIHDQFPKMNAEQVARYAEYLTRATQGVAPPEQRGYLGGSKSGLARLATSFSSWQEVKVRLYDQAWFDYRSNPHTKGDKKLLFKRMAAILVATLIGPAIIRWSARALTRMRKGEWDWKDGNDLLRQELLASLGDVLPGYGIGTLTAIASMAITGKARQVRTDPLSDTIGLAGRVGVDIHKVAEHALEASFNDTVIVNNKGEEVWKKDTEKMVKDSLDAWGRAYGNGIPSLIYDWGKGGYDLIFSDEPSGRPE